MKTLITTTLILCMTTAFAAKGNRPERGDRDAIAAAMKALHEFDKNGNKTIDGDEIAAVKKAFADAPSGPLKALDKNKDGKLDDEEIKPANPRAAAAELMKEIDKDRNHKIEGAEIEALKKKFETNSRAFGRIDHNGNGKLDDDEIAKLNERLGERIAASKGGKRKKDSAAPSNIPTTPTPPPTDAPKPKAGEEIKKADPTPAK
jgi:Ca2+-binding EF-hand superfamily protein